MCKLCEEKHRQDMLNELASKRMKTILNNALSITPKQMILGAYKQGATDMALAVISQEENKSDIDYQI